MPLMSFEFNILIFKGCSYSIYALLFSNDAFYYFPFSLIFDIINYVHPPHAKLLPSFQGLGVCGPAVEQDFIHLAAQ